MKKQATQAADKISKGIDDLKIKDKLREASDKITDNAKIVGNYIKDKSQKALNSEFVQGITKTAESGINVVIEKTKILLNKNDDVPENVNVITLNNQQNNNENNNSNNNNNNNNELNIHPLDQDIQMSNIVNNDININNNKINDKNENVNENEIKNEEVKKEEIPKEEKVEEKKEENINNAVENKKIEEENVKMEPENPKGPSN